MAAGSVAPLANLIGKNVAIALALVKSRATGAPHAKGLVGNTSAAGGGNEFRALRANLAESPPPPTASKSGPRRGTLRLAQACGMLGSSGRGIVEGGGILQFDLAP